MKWTPPTRLAQNVVDVGIATREGWIPTAYGIRVPNLRSANFTGNGGSTT